MYMVPHYIGKSLRRHLSITSKALAKSHYDSLGITPKATQAEIKAAYYKLSMVYHPDKNEGCEDAAKQFRAITTAYEVLGNVRLRRLYDKGMYFDGAAGAAYPETVTVDREAKFYNSREIRTRPPQPDGRTPIYDFDEWSKSHYGATFARDMHNKKRQQNKEYAKKQDLSDAQTDRIFLCLGIIVIMCMYFTQDKNLDENKLKNSIPESIQENNK